MGLAMSASSQATKQKFPFSYDAVFDGLIMVLPRLEMSIKNQDKLIGRITASAFMSLMSWGENLTIIVEKIDEQSTTIEIESSLKMGINLSGAHRHQKNFEEIIMHLSKYLQNGDSGLPPLMTNRQYFVSRGIFLVFVIIALYLLTYIFFR